MKTKSRLLGLAFASADLLVEINGDGEILYALGAGPVAGAEPATTWPGQALNSFLGRASGKLVEAALKTAVSGVRSTPVDILVACEGGRVRRARFSAFQLPELAPAISCAISWEGAAFALEIPATRPLLDPDALIGRVRTRLAGSNPDDRLAFAFIEVPGLAGDGDPHQRAAARIEAVLQSASIDGESAARLAPERFAVLRADGDSHDLVAEVLGAGLAEAVSLTATASDVRVEASTPVPVTLKALRYALEGCIREGALTRPDVAFKDCLRRTMDDADRFQAIVRAREFEVQYQPIVDLTTGATHHFEALARLGGKTGPGETIRMAEELGLIEGFDLAVAEKVIRQLRRPGFGLVKVAANMSGASLGSDAYVQAILRLTAGDQGVRKRLIVEVTETSAIADLASADRRMAALRAVGIQVCLDDFGAGAASLEYVRRLNADIVKIDGAFVQDVGANDRSRSLVAHVVDLCGELGMQTVAEMIETEAQAAAMRALRVDFGQGWLFGKPTPEPATPPAVSPVASRRAGPVVAWA